jgi:glycosyltransferase involved in cell wall biosynthesis
MLVPFFPPAAGGGVYRPLSFVRHLPRYGWRTTVVTPEAGTYWIRDESLLERVPPECRVVRTRSWSGQAALARARSGRAAPKRSSRGFGIARRMASAVLLPDSYIGWYPFAVRAAIEVTQEDRVDAILSTSPPESTHLAARAVHRRTGLPWVADFRDPWMNLHLLEPPTSWHAEIHRRLERDVCRDAQLIVTTRWHESLLRAAHPGARVTRVSNGYDGEELSGLERLTPPARPLRIVHAGMLTQRRSATPFLEAVARVVASEPLMRAGLRVEFVGPREDENELSARRLRLDDVVVFRDPLPHAETLRTQGEAHILLLVKHDNPRYDGLVPGKLYEYIGLRRPVLALAPDGEARDLVVSLRRGEVAPPADVDAIERALRVMITHHREGRLETAYDLSPRPEFDRSRLAGDVASVLDAAAGGGAR